MNCTIKEELLDEFVDGALNGHDRAEIEEHIGGCEACRHTVDFLVALQTGAADLPREIEPDRDLWPELEARIAPTRVTQVDFRPRGPLALFGARSVTGQWAAIAAAALVLIIASSGITAYFMSGQVLDPGSTTSGIGGIAEPVGSTLEAFRPAEIGYVQAIDDLVRALDERREELDPETITVIEANLRVIDAAIRRTKAAIEKYPESPELATVLADNYRRKLGFLQRTTKLLERS
jgi:hypothetical protein